MCFPAGQPGKPKVKGHSIRPSAPWEPFTSCKCPSVVRKRNFYCLSSSGSKVPSPTKSRGKPTTCCFKVTHPFPKEGFGSIFSSFKITAPYQRWSSCHSPGSCHSPPSCPLPTCCVLKLSCLGFGDIPVSLPANLALPQYPVCAL